MTNSVIAFEIPVRDLERAITFYAAVFGCAFERETVDGNEMAWFPVDKDAPGASGALARGDSYTPSEDGMRIYFKTEDIDATLARAVAASAQVRYPKTSIGALGWVAEFTDSEGNRLALHQAT